ncbi:hypothetical protein [Spirosoma foliorum]|uniref:Uncharacterized protein n=1 Tax=Spirosoma foliorum TaxID=2710596 RepID=A0A7G5H1Y6_9BACT|nr:hypothetical protein [Spirosoma foliorum]QMW05128.1 hypothetical protein H3H32_09675 [Spirosoma foliorum]
MTTKTSRFNWQNTYSWASLIGFIIWSLTIIGKVTYFAHDGLGYGIVVMGPVYFFIPALQILLCGLTTYRWQEWRDHRKRMITLVCSLGVLASLPLLIVLKIL